MGYYTNFSLKVIKKVEGVDIEVDEIEFPEFNEKIMYSGDLSIQELIDGTDSMKWYDHEEDMLEISKKFPSLVFILDGDGEESGDIWREFYMNGKSYFWNLDIERPDFDPKNLC